MAIFSLCVWKVTLVLATLLINVGLGKCSAFVEVMACATLYSRDNFTGDIFQLKDFDQIVNPKRDYRLSSAGWQNTGSIRVESNCSVTICADTNFLGTCVSLPEGDYLAIQLLSRIRSLNCTCARECSCEDIFIPKNNRTCGRAYLEDGCNKCNSRYIQLFQTERSNFFEIYKNSVTAIVLRKGCTLTVYSEKDLNGDSHIFSDALVENFNGTIASYKIHCDDGAFAPQKLIKATGTDSGHMASIKSLFAGKSHRNAYILLLGAYNPNVIGLFGCDSVNDRVIGECQISVELDDFENFTTQIRVIYMGFYKGLYGDEYSNRDNSERMSSLDRYLSNHEELDISNPNAVVLYHYTTDRNIIDNSKYWFNHKLASLNALLLERLGTDYTNIVYVLNADRSHGQYASPSIDRNSEEVMAEFEKLIFENWPFHQPTVICLNAGQYVSSWKVNGYWKMANHEYSPKNLQDSLMLLAEKSEDPLGYVIFKFAFPEERALKAVGQIKVGVSNDSPKLGKYRSWLDNPNTAKNRSRVLAPEVMSLKFRELVLSRVCEQSREQKQVENWKLVLEEKMMKLQELSLQLQEKLIKVDNAHTAIQAEFGCFKDKMGNLDCNGKLMQKTTEFLDRYSTDELVLSN